MPQAQVNQLAGKLRLRVLTPNIKDNFWDFLILKWGERKFLGYPWKVWGETVQTSYWVGGIKIESAAGRQIFFIKRKWKFVKNGNSLLFGLQLKNEERYRDGSNGWNDAYIQGNKCPVDKKWLRGRFDRVLPARSWEMPVERELPAKIGQCSIRRYGHDFQNSAKATESAIFFIYMWIYCVPSLLGGQRAKSL